jgi:anti-sigma regulatory factor (Ser/Thr protein kinase)
VAAIIFRDVQKTALRFLIEPNTPFQRILEIFSELRYPDSEIADEQINFAILELVSNSLRAHQEKRSAESIVVEFRCVDKALRVAIQDTGGGFDPSDLPYSFDEPVSSMNMMSPAFQAYRERHANQRFGMGLVAVRRVFPRFSLVFIDKEMNSIDWPSEVIVGTRIDLELPLALAGRPLAGRPLAS